MFFPSSVSALVFCHLTMKCPFMTFFVPTLLGLWSLLNQQVNVFVSGRRFWPSSLQMFIPILFIYTEREKCSLLTHRSLKLSSLVCVCVCVCVCVPFFFLYSSFRLDSFYWRFFEDTDSPFCHIQGTIHLGKFSFPPVFHF